MPVLPTTAELAERYRISDGKKFHLKNMDPADPWGKKLKKIADEMMKQSCKRLSKLQERLYAHDRWSVLIIFQAMDAAGKDSTIKNVMSGVNPQGCEVHSFKAPSQRRARPRFPLAVGAQPAAPRPHRHLQSLVLRRDAGGARAQGHPRRQQLPRELVTPKIWTERFEDINAFEQYLSQQGVLVRKFFLHVSKDEQRKRFLRRLDEPDKNWKFSPGDVKEREHYDEYMKAYEDTIRHTATPWAPWHVIPADRKWLMRLLVSTAIIDAIESIDPRFPEVDPEVRAEFARLKAQLEKERRRRRKGKSRRRNRSRKSRKAKAEKEKAEKGEDEKEEGVKRCSWPGEDPLYVRYHDEEWGRPIADDRRLFEKICLEGFQSGLSWITILRKRENFRRAFADFDAARVARFGARDIQRLLKDEGIVRHRGKIESTINNAKRALDLIEEKGSLAAYFWSWEPAARDRPKRLTRAALVEDEHDAAINGDVEGLEGPRLDVRGADDQLRVHAGHGPRERSRRRLRRSRRHRARPRPVYPSR